MLYHKRLFGLSSSLPPWCPPCSEQPAGRLQEEDSHLGQSVEFRVQDCGLVVEGVGLQDVD